MIQSQQQASPGNLKDRQRKRQFFQVLKEKHCSPRMLYQETISFRKEGEETVRICYQHTCSTRMAKGTSDRKETGKRRGPQEHQQLKTHMEVTWIAFSLGTSQSDKITLIGGLISGFKALGLKRCVITEVVILKCNTKKFLPCYWDSSGFWLLWNGYRNPQMWLTLPILPLKRVYVEEKRLVNQIRSECENSMEPLNFLDLTCYYGYRRYYHWGDIRCPENPCNIFCNLS